MQRKVFRIEAMMAGGRPVAASYAEHRRANGGHHTRAQAYVPADQQPCGRDGHSQHGLQTELTLIRDTLACTKRDLSHMIGSTDERHIARAGDELGAAVDGMEKATQKILKSIEVVDDSAKALTASLKDDYKRGLAQEIQDNVMRIYEACNFQDIAGQRIGNVMKTLAAIEAQVADMLSRCDDIPAAGPVARAALPPERGLLNGPKLDRDAGHATQRDIDMMFG